jgi:regulator of protease activity HflC (stomatin/prohibitin superfamily)
MINKAFFLAIITICISSCAIILQDEIGVKRTLGRINNKVLYPGSVFLNPFISTVIKVPVRTVNLAINVGLPSKEGLTIQAEISILYKIKPVELPNILKNTGLEFQEVVILPVFRSAAADICAKYEAKDMHSNKRSLIEKEIRERMMEVTEPKGFIIESVLMKSISLPPGLAKTIEEKMQSEQEAQRMEFLKDREKREAERKVLQAEGEKQSRIIAAEAQKRITEIEAEGKANALKIEADAQMKANDLLTRSLTPQVLKAKQIEAFRVLSTSPNTKVIITDGKTPLIGIPEN